MRFLSFLILLLAIFSFSACHHYIIRDKSVYFETPFGSIEKGASMAEVTKVLGNPHDVSYYRRREFWQYNFKEKGKVFIYFINGNVGKVRFEQRGDYQDKSKTKPITSSGCEYCQ
jgi:outer membrane protein assembly factor BamE (lipoprotein component of BamABCDE complex)